MKSEIKERRGIRRNQCKKKKKIVTQQIVS